MMTDALIKTGRPDTSANSIPPCS